MKTMEKELLGVEQLASILKIEEGTIYDHRWKKRNNLPLLKLGKKLFCEKKAFWKWVELRQIKTE
jgi:hypothetical protein